LPKQTARNRIQYVKRKGFEQDKQVLGLVEVQLK
jgi:hypothetical protein